MAVYMKARRSVLWRTVSRLVVEFNDMFMYYYMNV